MAIFTVQLPSVPGPATRTNRAGLIVVAAPSVASAREIARAKFGGDTDAWSDTSATVTQLIEPTNLSANALLGWRFTIRISGVASLATGPVIVTGDATNDTLDEVGTALAVALNALPEIAGAVYTAATQTLTVAAIADNLGDRTVVMGIFPPIELGGGQQLNADVHQAAGYVSSITHQGIVAAALTVVFVGDTSTVPTVFATA